MSRFPFELAGPGDDADLRHVLAATPMDGTIRVSFQREPWWFAAPGVDGRLCQIVACRDRTTGRIFGFGCRAIRDVFINGQPGVVGYLSNLRVLPEYRNRGLVARGYAFFRQLHQDGLTPFYYTTIAAGNETALAVLTAGRAGLPRNHAAGAFHTVAIALPWRGKVNAPPDFTIRPAQEADVPRLVEFLNTVGPRRQFFPRYAVTDFSPGGALQGLAPGDVLLAERRGSIVGALAGWDQHAYRQRVVHAYGGWLGRWRPVYNGWAWLRGRAGLPAVGAPLRLLLAALPVVADDDAGVLRALLAALVQRARTGPWSHVLVGLHAADPLLPLVRRYQSACYTTQLYLVCWDDGEAARRALDGRPPYLESGSL